MPNVHWSTRDSMNNLPDMKDDQRIVVGRVTENDKITIINSHVSEREDCMSYVICEFPIKDWKPEGVANAIARAISEARDIGFKQGQAYIRKALGIKYD